MINIYLIRHGEAESSSHAVSDFDRKLTAKGKEDIKKAAEGWKQIISQFNIIASSPFIRAEQTAEIIASVFNYKEKIITDKRIASGSGYKDFLNFIESFEEENIAIVGHEPDLSRNLSALVSSSGMFVDFKKGSIAKINFEGKIRTAGGILELFIPLKLFL